MAEFIIRVLKWLAALVTAYFLLFVLVIFGFIIIGIAFQPVPQSVEKDSILVMDLGMNLTDQPSSGSAAAILRDALSGEISDTVSLRQVLDGLEKAKSDSDIHGLLITGNLTTDGYGGSFATLRELRRALTAFGNEKPVWALIKGDRLRDYYIKSAATRIVSDPYALIDFRGLRAERIYWGKAFERIGIEFQIEAFEEFKTAGESLTEGSMSEAEKEQLTSIVNDLWATIVQDVAASRGVSEDQLNRLAGRNLIIYGEEATQGHLADEAMNEDEFNDLLARQVGYNRSGDSFRQFDFLDYLYVNTDFTSPLELNGKGNKVAILYVEGIIVDGKTEDGTIGADTVNEHLRELRKDDSVKAVVVRVNSPGGSAMASDRIVRELTLTRAEKPLVISMGGVAASGGYMISVVGDHIFAESTTITGSIGVISMLPNVEKMAEKLSISFEGVETHPFAGSFSIGRAKTDEEMQQLRAFGAQTYDDFMKLVAVNREMSLKQVRSLAKGRVWSGKAAIELGLADSEGGLLAAVQRAADMAGIGDSYHILERPRALTFEEQIEEMLSGTRATKGGSGASLRNLVHTLESEIQRLEAFDDPHGQYLILPYSLKFN